jgi:hypothetical protein
MTNMKLTDKEHAEVSRAFTSALKGIASGDAPSTGLRVMALRAMSGISVANMTLRGCAKTATQDEIEALGELHIRAVLRGVRH